jgi:hypothetical protein
VTARTDSARGLADLPGRASEGGSMAERQFTIISLVITVLLGFGIVITTFAP